MTSWALPSLILRFRICWQCIGAISASPPSIFSVAALQIELHGYEVDLPGGKHLSSFWKIPG
jgi:hypothetical protein